MEEKSSKEDANGIPKKLKPSHNMTTATAGLGRPISEGLYCGIREIPDLMEIEPAKAADIGL
ncbi:MAG TPA: hypothetical protein PLB52_03975 [Candidatus Moranbacteria bacterium]|mgnify:CR=1 FL=1|nr:hypothetical protein [Candidatus Moranbacteria bacterium]